MKRYQDVFSLAPANTIDGLFRDGILRDRNGHELVDYWRGLIPQMSHTDELGGFQLLEIRSSLPDELLMYADKLSMAHSLEVRVPYLDRTVVEYVQRLGAGFKVRSGSRKWLHRRVCEHYLPSQILKRKKRGFAVNVVDDWFRSSLNGKISGALLDESSLMFGLLDPKRVRRLLEDHRSGRQDNHKLLFSLVMVEQWLRGSATSRRQSSFGQPLIA
jgi:asparagine synthase (glutamine-hydrolysing)